MSTAPLSAEELVRLLLLWFGASAPAFVLTVWCLASALGDLFIAFHTGAGRLKQRRKWQALSNLVLSVTFFVAALFFVLLGVGAVTRVLHFSFTGPAAYGVLLPPVIVTLQVLAVQVNRVIQRRITGEAMAAERALRARRGETPSSKAAIESALD